MSKQSNQRYRKEKEKESSKKAGMDNANVGSGKTGKDQNKINHTFDAPSDR